MGGDLKDAAARAAEPLKKHEILKTTPMTAPVIAPAEAKDRIESKAKGTAVAKAAPTAGDRVAALETTEGRSEAPAMPKPPALPVAGAPVPLAPEQVAALKRREEILRGIDPKILAPVEIEEKSEAKPAKTPDAPTMSPAERRKRLFALSEEMELIYARSLGE